MYNDNELLTQLHRDLDAGKVRVSLLLVLIFLVFVGLWCWSQQAVTP